VSIATQKLHTKADLVEQVGSTFTIHVSDVVTVPAVLFETVDGPTSPGTEQFALHFRLPVETPPVQRTYDLDHPVLGALQLFLVPIGRDAAGLQLEAVFSRRTDQAPSEDDG
jgi:hypothetical protein